MPLLNNWHPGSRAPAARQNQNQQQPPASPVSLAGLHSWRSPNLLTVVALGVAGGIVVPLVAAQVVEMEMKREGLLTRFPKKFRKQAFLPGTAMTIGGSAALAGLFLGWKGVTERDDRKLGFGAGLYTVGSLMSAKYRSPMMLSILGGAIQALDDAEKTAKGLPNPFKSI